MARFSTVGHSTHSFEEFLAILRPAGVDVIADVRRFPRSRSNPVYNIETLPERLADHQIRYLHMPGFGGRRGRQKDVPREVNAGWRNDSFHNFADYALSAEFGQALDKIMKLGQERHYALMCAEAVWWRCHRRIIADYLIFAGHEVVHLMGPGKESPAQASPDAVRTPDGKVIYPAS